MLQVPMNISSLIADDSRTALNTILRRASFALKLSIGIDNGIKFFLSAEKNFLCGFKHTLWNSKS